MNEKELLLANRKRERMITLKVLKAFPADKSDFKPHEISRSAIDLAHTFSIEDIANRQSLSGKIDFSKISLSAPKTWNDVVNEYEQTSEETDKKIIEATEEQLNQQVQFGPMTLRAIDVIQMLLLDHIHHRGQFSVYLRMVGGKVPSIYGPSYDEKDI